MTTHWVKQLSLILDKDMTSFLERFWPLLSKSTTEAVFWPLGLRGRVISSIQSFAFPASMDDDDRRRFFLRKTTMRAFSFFPWYKTTHLMKCWLNHAKKLNLEALELKKPTYISNINVEPSSILNYSRALRNFLCQWINLFFFFFFFF